MKRPDEIKKDLKDALPAHVHFHKGDPEPRLTYYNYHALECLHADALAYIRQLEAERDAAFKDINKNCYTCGVSAETIHEEPCNSCRRAGGNKENWEWRGVQKEE